MQTPTKNQKRLTLGFLIDMVDQEYARLLMTGVTEACKLHDVNLVVFEGCGDFGTAEDNRNFLGTTADLAIGSPLDGFLVTSGVLANFSNERDFQTYLTRYQPTPVISLGLPVAGVPSLLIEDLGSLSFLIEHLIRHHGRRSFVFLRGVPNNLDSQVREQVFLSTLQKHGLEPLPQGLLSGDYRTDTAYDALTEFIREGGRPDAVVAANDEMAVGALFALRDAGVEIPQQASVIGFDDDEKGRFLSLPLTTVSQPIQQLGFEGTEWLLRILTKTDGGDVPVLVTEPVIRRSCGCQSHIVEEIATPATDAIHPGALELSVRLETLLEQDLENGGASNLFLLRVDAELRERARSHYDFSVWQQALSLIRSRMKSAISDDKAEKLEVLLHQGRVVLQESAQLIQAQELTQQRQANFKLQFHTNKIARGYGMTSFVDRLTKTLEQFELDSAALALYRPGERDKSLFALLKMEGGCAQPLSPADQNIAQKDLLAWTLPQRQHRFDLLVRPLFFDEEPLGVFVLEQDAMKVALSDAFSRELCSAIKGSFLLEELRAANEQVQKDHVQLLASEKMASLGRLTAGIAHEMNTPLATVRASLHEIGGLVKEYEDSLGNRTITEEDHRAIVDELKRAINLADRAAARATTFIRSIKTQTRETDADTHVRFDAVAVVRETLMLLDHQFRAKGAAWHLTGAPSPVPMVGDPGKFSQVVTNLVNNSLDALVDRGGSIGLDFQLEQDLVVLSVKDDGTGISPDVKHRIFDPFFTTKRFGEGTGLGLTIVRDIVTGAFGGTVEVVSEAGQGTTFVVRLKTSPH